MTDYSSLETTNLLNILMTHTTHLMAMITEGTFSGDDFIQCRDTIICIQAEITKRQKPQITSELPPELWTYGESLPQKAN